MSSPDPPAPDHPAPDQSAIDQPTPDRLAIALHYERDGDSLPHVTARGRGAVAAQILALAEANGVPVEEDGDLAEILATLEPGSPIPVAAFAAVAEILAFLYRANAEHPRAPKGATTSGTAEDPTEEMR